MLPNARIEQWPGDETPQVVLTGPWDSRIGEHMRREQLDSLEVNYARGFVGGDLEFLREVPHVRGLLLLDPGLRDLSPIYGLRDLEVAQFSTRLPHALDFTRFPALRRVACQWRKGCESLFGATGLTFLDLSAYPGETLREFRSLPGLERLELVRGRLQTLEGVEGLRALRHLGVYHASHLTSLVGAEATELDELHVETCKRVNDIPSLATASSIRRLAIANCGEIASLGPVATMTNLEHLTAFESTNIVDGDLTPLLRAPKLRSIQLQSRRHYRPSRAEVERALEARRAAARAQALST